MRIKKKEEDLACLDGVAVPFWAKILIFVFSFLIGFVVAYFIMRSL